MVEQMIGMRCTSAAHSHQEGGVPPVACNENRTLLITGGRSVTRHDGITNVSVQLSKDQIEIKNTEQNKQSKQDETT